MAEELSPPPRRPSLSRALGRALRRRCPACGEGRLFDGPFRMRGSCPACGWVTEREPGSFTGPMYLVAAVTETFAALLAILLLFLTDWPPKRIFLVGLPLLLLFSLWCFPTSKAVWAAIDFATDAAAGDGEREGRTRG